MYTYQHEKDFLIKLCKLFLKKFQIFFTGFSVNKNTKMFFLLAWKIENFQMWNLNSYTNIMENYFFISQKFPLVKHPTVYQFENFILF